MWPQTLVILTENLIPLMFLTIIEFIWVFTYSTPSAVLTSSDKHFNLVTSWHLTVITSDKQVLFSWLFLYLLVNFIDQILLKNLIIGLLVKLNFQVNTVHNVLFKYKRYGFSLLTYLCRILNPIQFRLLNLYLMMDSKVIDPISSSFNDLPDSCGRKPHTEEMVRHQPTYVTLSRVILVKPFSPMQWELSDSYWALLPTCNK